MTQSMLMVCALLGLVCGPASPAGPADAAATPGIATVIPLAANGRCGGPDLMPLHPDVLARIRAEGYDSVTMVSLRRLAELKQEKGIDKPQPIAAPVIGQRPALVLLVDFGDLAHDSVSTAGMYNNLLFCYRWCTEPGSMFQYFGEASHGKLDIYPRGMCDWQQTGQPHDYYADADGIPGTDDDYGFGSFPQNAQGLVVDAVLLADPFINFRTYALGGQVHGLFVVHAGRGAETDPSHADWIWSHQWELGPHAVTADWVTVDEYVMCPEYTYDPGDSSIGVFCHEYAHLLGLPDLYDTDYSSAGVGDWSLMASGSWNLGGTSPAYPDAWCRTQLGWATPQVPDDPFEDDVFVGDVASYNSVYQLWTRNETGPEYFLVEKRRWLSNDFDAGLPGQGLLVYHVDENASQNDDWHPMVMVEQADGLWDLQLGVNSGDAGDPFPGITANSALNAFTAPSTLSYDEQDTQVAVGDIRDPYISDLVDLTVQTLFEGDDPWISYLGSWYDLGVGSAGHLRYSDETAARASISFLGTGIKWRVARGPMMGNADAYLDGSYAATLDLYRPSVTFVTPAKIGISRGWHTAEVRVAGEKNPSSSGYYVTVDAFEVVP